MTADEFVERYRSEVMTLDFLRQDGFSLEFVEEWKRTHSITRRKEPLYFDIPMFDETLSLVRDYNVEQNFSVLRKIQFYAFNPRNEVQDLISFMERAIPIGKCDKHRLVFNFDSFDIELRPNELLFAPAEKDIVSQKVAHTGMRFFDAIIKFSPAYDKVVLARVKRGDVCFNQEENNYLCSVLPEVVQAAGGEQYYAFWYNFLNT